MAARFVRDEEAAGSNPATPTEKRQVTKNLVTCRLHYTIPDVRFKGNGLSNNDLLLPN